MLVRAKSWSGCLPVISSQRKNTYQQDVVEVMFRVGALPLRGSFVQDQRK